MKVVIAKKLRKTKFSAVEMLYGEAETGRFPETASLSQKDILNRVNTKTH